MPSWVAFNGVSQQEVCSGKVTASMNETRISLKMHRKHHDYRAEGATADLQPLCTITNECVNAALELSTVSAGGANPDLARHTHTHVFHGTRRRKSDATIQDRVGCTAQCRVQGRRRRALCWESVGAVSPALSCLDCREANMSSSWRGRKRRQAGQPTLPTGPPTS